MAGPREAIWRDHPAQPRDRPFIVGRDHAGPGKDSEGKPFYGPYDAQELAKKHASEIGMGIIPFQEMVYLPDEDRYEESDKVPAGAKTLAISGTQVRDDYLAKGKPLPPWFTRPETAAILAEMSPPQHEQGFCVWFTGLSGAGKSTTAERLTEQLEARGRSVTHLDGDVVRTHLSKGLGFSRGSGRQRSPHGVRRVRWCATAARLCAAVSPYRAARPVPHDGESTLHRGVRGHADRGLRAAR